MKTCITRVYARKYDTGDIGHICNNPGKIEIDGRWYCGIHNPVSIAERREKINVEYDGYIKCGK